VRFGEILDLLFGLNPQPQVELPILRDFVSGLSEGVHLIYIRLRTHFSTIRKRKLAHLRTPSTALRPTQQQHNNTTTSTTILHNSIPFHFISLTDTHRLTTITSYNTNKVLTYSNPSIAYAFPYLVYVITISHTAHRRQISTQGCHYCGQGSRTERRSRRADPRHDRHTDGAGRFICPRSALWQLQAPAPVNTTTTLYACTTALSIQLKKYDLWVRNSEYLRTYDSSCCVRRLLCC